MSSEKRQRYFEKALSEGLEENAIIFKKDKALGFICLGKNRDEDKDDSHGEIWE